MRLMRLIRGWVTFYNSITWCEGDDTLIPSIPQPSVSPLTEESVFWPMLIDKDGRMSQDYRVTISQFLRTNHSQGGRTLNILDLTDTSMCVIEDYSDKLSGMTHDSWLQTGHSSTLWLKKTYPSWLFCAEWVIGILRLFYSLSSCYWEVKIMRKNLFKRVVSGNSLQNKFWE